MKKFKIGDNVRVLTDYPDVSYFKKGDIFTVTKVSNDTCVGKKNGFSLPNYVNNKYLELYQKDWDD